jgi:hypothetical protein
VVSDEPTLKGDLVKKYKNGKIVEQKFVTEDKMNEMAMEGGVVPKRWFMYKGHHRRRKYKCKTIRSWVLFLHL